MRTLARKRTISTLGYLALSLAALSVAAADDPTAATQNAPKTPPVKGLSAFRREVIARLKPSISFAASDTYLNPQDYYGKSTDQQATGVACPAVSAVIDSLAKSVEKLRFARDYDVPNTDLDKTDCATYLRSTPTADFCKTNSCTGIKQRPERDVTDVARYCVYVDPRQARCDVTVISFGARWLVDSDTKWKSELRDANRDTLISETLKPVKETIQALSTAR
jgi:hypothetical protein